MVKKKKDLYEGEIDKRIIEKKILMGYMSEKELKEYLRSLPDVSDNVEEMRVEEPHRRK